MPVHRRARSVRGSRGFLPVEPDPERAMSSRPAVLHLFALALLAFSDSASALETRCVNSSSEIRSALLAADDDDVQINVVRGTYAFASNPMDAAPEPSLGHNVRITGGYDSN